VSLPRKPLRPRKIYALMAASQAVDSHSGPVQSQCRMLRIGSVPARQSILSLLVFGVLLGHGALIRAQGDALVRAHELYNLQQYDAAIRFAEEARRIPARADAAAVVSARAHLERYRQSSDAADLDAARTALTQLDDAKLVGRDRTEWTIGLGEVLYFDRRFSTAAEFFERGLANGDQLEPDARQRLLEWWASALDQQAQLVPEPERHTLYLRILSRADEELGRNDRSLVATYWLAAAAFGLDDLDRAWAAAEAGWIRAGSSGHAGSDVRADLDRLMLSAVIPARARHLAPTGDARPAVALLQEQWEQMKQRYSRN